MHVMVSAIVLLHVYIHVCVSLPPQFQAATVWQSTHYPQLRIGLLVQLAFFPDNSGRALLVDKQGKIFVVDPLSGPWQSWAMQTYMVAPPQAVHKVDEVGFVNVLFSNSWNLSDPSTHFIYLYWAATRYNGRQAGMRISRFRHVENLGGLSCRGLFDSEILLWQDTDGFPSTAHVDGLNEGQNKLWHYGGELSWGPDGNLYLGLGDKYRTDLVLANWSYAGCILRILPNGGIPIGNLQGVKPPECWAYGTRNPFRATWDTQSSHSRYIIADVGANDRSWAREDIYLGIAGANYGWPFCQGSCVEPPNISSCPCDLYNRRAIFSYAHSDDVVEEHAIIGGKVYHHESAGFGYQYHGSYFFADHSQLWIKFLSFDAHGNPGTTTHFHTLNDAPIDLSFAPDGSMYIVESMVAPKVTRIWFQPASNIPVIHSLTVSPTRGRPPLRVSLSANVSDSDTDFEDLSFIWLLGDLSFAYGQEVEHVFTEHGRFSVSLIVQDGLSQSRSEEVIVDAGVAPVISIISPQNHSQFRAGDHIFFSGRAVDVDEGDISHRIFWRVDFIHDLHVHPVGSEFTGENGSFLVDTSGHNIDRTNGFRIQAWVVDSEGIPARAHIEIHPQAVSIQISAEPDSLQLYTPIRIDGRDRNFPLRLESVELFNHEITVPEVVCVNEIKYNFVGWSDGNRLHHRVYRVPEFASTAQNTYLNLYYRTTGALCMSNFYMDGVRTALVLSAQTVETDSYGAITLWQENKFTRNKLTLRQSSAMSTHFRCPTDAETAPQLVEATVNSSQSVKFECYGLQSRLPATIYGANSLTIFALIRTSPTSRGSPVHVSLENGICVAFPSVAHQLQEEWQVISGSWSTSENLTNWIYLNGVYANASTVSTACPNTNSICVGCGFSGDVAEILVISGMVTQIDRSRIEEVLQSRKYPFIPYRSSSDDENLHDMSLACATIPENTTEQVACPAGDIIVGFSFASFGRPNGMCESFTLNLNCNTELVYERVSEACIGQNACTLTPTREVFGADSCPDVFFERRDGCCVDSSSIWFPSGRYTVEIVSHEAECRRLCLNDASCIAYETSFSGFLCEIHTAEVDLDSSAGYGCTCAAKRENGSLPLYLAIEALCAPPNFNVRVIPSIEPTDTTSNINSTSTEYVSSTSSLAQSASTSETNYLSSTSVSSRDTTHASTADPLPTGLSFSFNSTIPAPRCTERERNCRFCSHGSCTKCMNSHYLLHGVCIASCPLGTFPRGTGRFSRICLLCVENRNNCRFCNYNSTRCTKCKNSYYLSNEGVCMSQCPVGWEGVGNGRFGRFCRQSTACRSNQDGCNTCNANLTKCLQCRDSKYLLDNGTCGLNCPAGWNHVGNGRFNRRCSQTSICRRRQNSCHECTADKQSCTLCRDSRYLTLYGTCETECTVGVPVGNGRWGRRCLNSSRCVPRSRNCHDCSVSREYCTKCRNQHYLHLGNCIYQCPNSTRAVGRGNFNRRCIS